MRRVGTQAQPASAARHGQSVTKKAMVTTPSRPMDGLLVLDLAANIAGPLACQVMADLGAEVIKVEPPTGEAARHITATAFGAEQVTPYFSPYNRGKKSVRVELSTDEGLASLRGLVARADVVVQGLRPGTMARYGLSAADVRTLNPRCIYASVSAFGGEGALGQRPGVDMIVQAESGCLAGQPPGEVPRLIPFQLVDVTTGHAVAQAVLAALLHRERSGVVNEVAVAMYDVACSLQSNHLTLQMNIAAENAPNINRRAVAVEPSGVFPTADTHIVLAAYVPAHWEKFVHLIGRPNLAEDERFQTQNARARNFVELHAAIAECLATRAGADWISRLTGAGLMAAPIASRRDVVDSELFATRRLRLTAHQAGCDIDVVRPPALYSTFDAATSTDIPALGQHDALLTTNGEPSRL